MNIKWNAGNYKNQFSFVSQYGEDVISLITAKEKSFVIDLGCGNGALTQKLTEKGYKVIGIDASEDMISLAKSEYPNLNFRPEDALSFKLPQKADVIFSNAVFHWIDKDNQEKLIENISHNLNYGGELVCEFGGYGCGEMVHSTLEKCFNKRNLEYHHPFYFPTIGEYAPILEKYGLQTEYATLFERPTVQKSDDGLREWINMFVKKPFEGIDDNVKSDILDETNDILKNSLFIDGKWYIDYVRIRIRARKINND